MGNGILTFRVKKVGRKYVGQLGLQILLELIFRELVK